MCLATWPLTGNEIAVDFVLMQTSLHDTAEVNLYLNKVTQALFSVKDDNTFPYKSVYDAPSTDDRVICLEAKFMKLCHN